MRRITAILVFALCCIMACGLSCNAATKKKVNAKAPFAVISNAKINKKKLKKNEVFEYSFKISLVDSFNYKSKDLVTGPFVKRGSYYYVTIHWKSSKKQEVVQTFKWNNKKKSKTIKGKIPVCPGMQTGKWKIYKITIENYKVDDCDDEGATLTIHNGKKKRQKKTRDYYYCDLSFADFKVKGKRKADKQAPVVQKESLTLSKHYVEPMEKVKISIKVDDVSPIKKVKCSWWVTVDEPFYKQSTGEYWEEYRSCELKYNKETGCFEGFYALKKKDLKAIICDCNTEDMYGNKQTYHICDTRFDETTGLIYYEEDPRYMIYLKK